MIGGIARGKQMTMESARDRPERGSAGTVRAGMRVLIASGRGDYLGKAEGRERVRRTGEKSRGLSFSLGLADRDLDLERGRRAALAAVRGLPLAPRDHPPPHKT